MRWGVELQFSVLSSYLTSSHLILTTGRWNVILTLQRRQNSPALGRTASKCTTWNLNPSNQIPLPVGLTITLYCLEGARALECETKLNVQRAHKNIFSPRARWHPRQTISGEQELTKWSGGKCFGLVAKQVIQYVPSLPEGKGWRVNGSKWNQKSSWDLVKYLRVCYREDSGNPLSEDFKRRLDLHFQASVPRTYKDEKYLKTRRPIRWPVQSFW